MYELENGMNKSWLIFGQTEETTSAVKLPKFAPNNARSKKVLKERKK